MQVTCWTPLPSLKILCQSNLEFWVIWSSISHDWHCVCSHCACALPRDLYVGANISNTFEVSDPYLFIHFATAIMINQIITQNIARPLLNTMQLFSCARSRDLWIVDQKQLHISIQRPHFGCWLHEFCRATTLINGLFAWEIFTVRWFPVNKNFSPVLRLNLVFDGNVNFSFFFWPPEAHPCMILLHLSNVIVDRGVWL